VLRAGEYASFTPEDKAAFDREYTLVKVHDVRPVIAAETWLPGRDFLLFDAFFGVWHRRGEKGAP